MHPPNWGESALLRFLEAARGWQAPGRGGVIAAMAAPVARMLELRAPLLSAATELAMASTTSPLFDGPRLAG